MGKKIIAERWQRGDAVGGGGQATIFTNLSKHQPSAKDSVYSVFQRSK